MNFSKSLYALALGSVGIVGALSNVSAQAATLVNGDVLTITAGVPASFDSSGFPVGVASGSWFGCDCNGNSVLTTSELNPLSQGTTGIVIGVATLPGASHSGLPTAGDTNAIDAPFNFFGNTGSNFTTIGITGSTEAGLNMSGWDTTWNGIPTISLGSGAWGAGFSNGIGNFVWDGIYGHAYTLDYRATVPLGSPTGFGGVQFAWHYEGVVAVPEASTYGMMLAGLGLVGVAVRQRRQRVLS